MHPFLTITAYRFLPLDSLKERRARLISQCKDWKLQGSIVLSPEGINLAVTGAASQIELLLTELRSWPGLEHLQPRLSGSEQTPLRRMLVRIKRELVAFGVPGIDPARAPAAMITARELARWLDEARALTLLDVRNDYEVQLGTFRNALHLHIGQFRDLPAAVASLDCTFQSPVVVFCTSGIRSAKAAAFLERAGVRDVYQLDGGILEYFEQCSGAHYRGECFLFEQRDALDPNLPATRWAQCAGCRTVLDAADQAHANYQSGRHCPYCFEMPAERMAATLAQRHAQLQPLIVPLPGSVPRDHLRPVSIPAACDGLTLLAALRRIVPHVPEATLRERCAQGFLLDEAEAPCSSQQPVRAGERYHHRFPGLTEPDVNMQVELLYEDEALLVLNKPAPLPMHAGGRFHRNTLKYVLDSLYHPQRPRPAHRLDANTTGVLVVARTAYIAGKLQPQFARGEVEKVYLVRVQGHPPENEFECAAPISATAGEIGSRRVDAHGGLAALTRFKVLRRDAHSTLLEACPRTGRTNQIRVHLWHLGWPVYGDPAYLSGGVLGDSQTLPLSAAPLCLHAWRISFQHPVRRKTLVFTAPQPAWTAPH